VTGVGQGLQSLRDLLGTVGDEERERFSEPWQARAFALVLALSEKGLFSLKDFQAALIRRITEFEKTQCLAGGDDYYTVWIGALEDLLSERKLFTNEKMTGLEEEILFDAESRKAHQRASSRDEQGRLRIAPLLVDSGSV
jgi:nitrile hydratase accessory protein